jgi:hypothetical protein
MRGSRRDGYPVFTGAGHYDFGRFVDTDIMPRRSEQTYYGCIGELSELVSVFNPNDPVNGLVMLYLEVEFNTEMVLV